MARTVIRNTKILMLRKPFSENRLAVGRRNCMSTSARDKNQRNTDEASAPAGGERPENTSPARWWMPHPRTGIYFPAGQEWVMDDIPTDAASFDCTFWLRGIDGVDYHNDAGHYRN